MTVKKPHSDEPGFIHVCKNSRTNQHIVLYNGIEAGFDTSEGKYTIFCAAHGSFCCETNQKRARKLMQRPELWCKECDNIEDFIVEDKQVRVVPFGLKSPEEQERELRVMAKMTKGNPEKAALFESVYGVKPDLYWEVSETDRPFASSSGQRQP